MQYLYECMPTEMAWREWEKNNHNNRLDSICILYPQAHAQANRERQRERHKQSVCDLSAWSGRTQESNVSFNAAAIASEWSSVLCFVHCICGKLKFITVEMFWFEYSFFFFIWPTNFFFTFVTIMFPLGSADLLCNKSGRGHFQLTIFQAGFILNGILRDTIGKTYFEYKWNIN